MSSARGIAFRHVPFGDDKASAFRRVGDLLREAEADLVILARFMQVLPGWLCSEYAARVINIHHSFLPAFVGANPYKRAFERGVKLIGATCHYATEDLDAGPIIEQEVARVEHYHDPEISCAWAATVSGWRLRGGRVFTSKAACWCTDRGQSSFVIEQ